MHASNAGFLYLFNRGEIKTMSQIVKTAIVTGAVTRYRTSRGGKAGARRLLSSSELCGKAAKAGEVVAGIKSRRRKCHCRSGRRRERRRRGASFQEALAAFGRIDVVVNSAGIMLMLPIAEGNWKVLTR